MSADDDYEVARSKALGAGVVIARFGRSGEEVYEPLARAREQANAARTAAVATESWDAVWDHVSSYDHTGDIRVLAVPASIESVGLLGRRLANGLAAAFDDEDAVDNAVKLWRLLDDRELLGVALTAVCALAKEVISELVEMIARCLGTPSFRADEAATDVGS